MKETKKSLFPYYKKVDLSEREKYRVYEFPNGEIIMINGPQFLIVSDNGHRIYDNKGISHYIPYGWIHLWWVNKNKQSFYCESGPVVILEE